MMATWALAMAHGQSYDEGAAMARTHGEILALPVVSARARRKNQRKART